MKHAEILPSPAVWTLRQAAAHMNCSIMYVRKLVYSGRLAHQLLGRGYVLDPGEVRAFIDSGWGRNGSQKTGKSALNSLVLKEKSS
jgi:excisionase family DNA binding protein